MAKATKSPKKRLGWAGGMFAVAIGIGVMGCGVFMALSLATGDANIDPKVAATTCWTGLLGAYASFGAINTLGKIPALVLAALLFFWGAYIAKAMRVFTTWPAVFGGILIVLATALGVCAFGDSYDINTGGLLAIYVSPPALLYFGRWGMTLAAVGLMLLGILLAFGETAVMTVHKLIFTVRDALGGLFGMAVRVKDLFKMLLSPRLAVAVGTAGAEAASAAFERETRPVRKNAARETKPSARKPVAVDAGDPEEEGGAEEPENLPASGKAKESDIGANREMSGSVAEVEVKPVEKTLSEPVKASSVPQTSAESRGIKAGLLAAVAKTMAAVSRSGAKAPVETATPAGVKAATAEKQDPAGGALVGDSSAVAFTEPEPQAPAGPEELAEPDEASESDDLADSDASGGAPAPVQEWKPRAAFQSRFLNLNLRDDTPNDGAAPVRAAVAAQTPKAKPVADVIMDVEALTEESSSDVIADAVISSMNGSKPVEAAKPEANRIPETREPAGAKPQPDPRPQAAVKPSPAAAAPIPAAPQPVQKTAPAVAGPVAKILANDAAKNELADYQLPPLELLDPPQPPVLEDRGELEARAKILEQTLAEFKIEGRVVHIERGPRVTMYEISLAPGIRLNKVTSLADNIAMQLQAESVRIIAPIPGKNTIGIEIPNMTKELVSLSEIVNAVNREKKRQALPVCLGKDVSGAALVADLSRMPHLLIAGATGSGKSVCINSIILSVMMCCKPDEAQMIMVDPTVVELSRFKDIPHLMSPVITDMKRAVNVLDWICQKMDERYEQLSQVSVNNIAKFNALGEEAIRDRLDEFASLEEIEAFPKKLPYMVVIIDELADLMMVAGKEVEHHITRLAAKSRAVGIHLILATQRPSVDVITGLIKANMPCRIAFQVASRVDSRTILDQNGAETLLGAGDMLYLPPGVGKLTRAQGVFVSDEELFRVVDYTKEAASPQYHSDLLGPVIGGGGAQVDVSDFDELFIQSGEAIIENQRGSVSLLQRKFGVGYGRASRIIDQLASVGLLGPFRDGKAREILLTMEEFHAKFGGGGRSAAPWDDDSEADDDGRPAGLRDDERERPQPDWGDEEEEA